MLFYHRPMHLLRFQFRLFPTLGMLLGMMLFVYLGLWQSGKGDRLAAELAQHAARNQLGAVPVGGTLVEAQALRDAPITALGTYEPQSQIFLDNRQENGLPGVHVITPLKIDGSETRILVNRGWIGWTQGRSVLPVVATPPGKIKVTGLAFVPSTKKFFLMPDHPEAAAQLWARLDMARFASLLGHPLQPVVVLQNSSDAQDTLVRRWDPPEDRVGMHRGYAFQWFGMAVALLIFYLVASVRKGDAV
jgi:surfeit locus 1 family protein